MVFNLDAALKESDKKVSEPFKFRYKRKTWTLQTPMTLDIRILLDPENDDISSLAQFKILLGEEQWDELPSIDVATTDMLMEAYAEYLKESEGVDLGESEPPTDS